ncbi:MAG: DNA repair protein RecN [Spirochaetae bacterium HGW-Spirochaetae-1]|jgi:DNA repair protein RecN (Recombination protein N)|nr:MAG: DNA repair protein RecN [Spirochaetae bacterium HGW-Spirochaetae-1]
MMTELRIKNFIIIEDLSINFQKGLNVLTGETGAGKSILIDAISGVLGEKMTTDMIRTGFEKATLEGSFDISAMPQVKEQLDDMGIEYDDDTLMLRRELYASGKGRCFMNAVQVPLTKVKDVSEYLLDIHGQNEHQNIVKISKHRELLDSFGGHQVQVEEIRKLHDYLNGIRDKLKSFEIDEREKLRRIEYNSFAIREIDAAGLSTTEEVELKNEATLLANAEKLFRAVNRTAEHLNGENGVFQQLKRAEQSLSTVSEYDTEISNILEIVKESLFSLEDVSCFLRDYQGKIDFSPERINQVEERLALMATLKKKYGDTVEDILEYAEKARRELHAITSSDEEIERLHDEEKRTVKTAKEKALALSDARKGAARMLEDLVMKELKDLGMGGTIFRVSIKREVSPEGDIETEGKTYVLYPHGLDRVEFLISANEGEDLKQLRKVASGGEMSRIMLALKNVILSSDIVETLIFDEVDAGIGGKIADIVGKKLKLLARNRQVLLITHLPQIASMSDNHYYIQKGKTGDRVTTIVRNLNRKDKVKEIARMLSGENITDITLQHAEEMVAHAEAQ